MEKIDYSIICSGIRDLVRELREVHGIETTDSGDGTHHAEGMDCAFPERHVFMRVDVGVMIESTEFLGAFYPKAHVECSWSPGEPAIIMLWPDGPFTEGTLWENGKSEGRAKAQHAGG